MPNYEGGFEGEKDDSVRNDIVEKLSEAPEFRGGDNERENREHFNETELIDKLGAMGADPRVVEILHSTRSSTDSFTRGLSGGETDFGNYGDFEVVGQIVNKNGELKAGGKISLKKFRSREISNDLTLDELDQWSVDDDGSIVRVAANEWKNADGNVLGKNHGLWRLSIENGNLCVNHKTRNCNIEYDSDGNIVFARNSSNHEHEWVVDADGKILREQNRAYRFAEEMQKNDKAYRDGDVRTSDLLKFDKRLAKGAEDDEMGEYAFFDESDYVDSNIYNQEKTTE